MHEPAATMLVAFGLMFGSGLLAIALFLALRTLGKFEQMVTGIADYTQASTAGMRYEIAVHEQNRKMLTENIRLRDELFARFPDRQPPPTSQYTPHSQARSLTP